jgi:hypothetical protein
MSEVLNSRMCLLSVSYQCHRLWILGCVLVWETSTGVCFEYLPWWMHSYNYSFSFLTVHKCLLLALFPQWRYTVLVLIFLSCCVIDRSYPLSAVAKFYVLLIGCPVVPLNPDWIIWSMKPHFAFLIKCWNFKTVFLCSLIDQYTHRPLSPLFVLSYDPLHHILCMETSKSILRSFVGVLGKKDKI